MNHSPADIINELLIEKNKVFSGASTDDEWPGYVGHEPEVPDACVTLYDTSPEIQGRILATGVTVRRWGFQLRLRSAAKDYSMGWKKITDLDTFLTTTNNTLVTMNDSTAYRIQSISCDSGPMFVGLEEQSRRNMFTANYLCSVSAV